MPALWRAGRLAAACAEGTTEGDYDVENATLLERGLGDGREQRRIEETVDRGTR